MLPILHGPDFEWDLTLGMVQDLLDMYPTTDNESPLFVENKNLKVLIIK